MGFSAGSFRAAWLASIIAEMAPCRYTKPILVNNIRVGALNFPVMFMEALRDNPACKMIQVDLDKLSQCSAGYNGQNWIQMRSHMGRTDMVLILASMATAWTFGPTLHNYPKCCILCTFYRKFASSIR